MDKKTIARGVLNDPLIQQCLKEGALPQKELLRLIAEEVVLDEEAQPKAIRSAKSNINTKYKEAKAGGVAGLEGFIKKAPNYMKGKLKQHPQQYQDDYNKIRNALIQQAQDQIKVLKAAESPKVPDEKVAAAQAQLDNKEAKIDQAANAEPKGGKGDKKLKAKLTKAGAQLPIDDATELVKDPDSIDGGNIDGSENIVLRASQTVSKKFKKMVGLVDKWEKGTNRDEKANKQLISDLEQVYEQLEGLIKALGLQGQGMEWRPPVKNAILKNMPNTAANPKEFSRVAIEFREAAKQFFLDGDDAATIKLVAFGRRAKKEPDPAQSTAGEPQGGEASSGAIDLITGMMAEVLAEKAAGNLVKPIMEKIQAVTTGVAAGGAVAAAGTGGTSLLATLAAGAARVLGVAALNAIADVAIQKMIKVSLVKLFKLLPQVEKLDQQMMQIVGKELWEQIEAAIKAGTPDAAKKLIADEWELILKQLMLAAAGGKLGEPVRGSLQELVNYDIKGVQVGAMFASWFLPEEAILKLGKDDITNHHQQGKEEAPEAEPEKPGELDTSAAEAKYGEALKPFLKGDEYTVAIKFLAVLLKNEILKEGTLQDIWQHFKLDKNLLSTAVKSGLLTKDDKKLLIAILRDPEKGKKFHQVMKGAPEGDPEEKPEEQPQPVETAAEAVEILKDSRVDDFIEGYNNFNNNFLEVPTLKQQSDLFKGLWDPSKVLAGRLEKKVMAAYSRKAPADAEGGTRPQIKPLESEPEINEATENPDAGNQMYVKQIISRAAVTQRNTDRIRIALKILQKEVGTGGSVSVANIEALEKFGDGNPKRLLYKFLRLTIGDINGLVEFLTPLEAEVEYIPDEEDEEENPPLQEYEDEEGHGSGKSREEKIEMVEKMYEDVKPIAQQIIQSTKQIQTQGENNKPGDETPADLGGGVTDDGLDEMLADIDKDNEENPLQERLNNLLGLNRLALITEAEPKVGDNVTNMDNPHGAEQGGKGAKGRKAHEQLLLNIQNQAEQIYQIMEPLKEFFPTANPLKTEESIDDAVRAFENAVKNLNIIITQINTWAGKGNIDPSLVKEFKNKLISLRDTLAKVFGVKAGEGNEIKIPNTEEQAAISDAGNESGLPEDSPGDKEVTSDSAGEKDKKPFDISSPSQFVKFLTSSQGLLDSRTRQRVKKLGSPPAQLAALRFLSYLIAYKDPSVKENLNTLRTTAVKYFGFEKEAMAQVIQALKKHDSELLNSVIGLITPSTDAKKGKDRKASDASEKGNRMYFAAFLKAAKERLEEFEIKGDWMSRMTGGQMAKMLSNEVLGKALDVSSDAEGGIDLKKYAVKINNLQELIKRIDDIKDWSELNIIVGSYLKDLKDLKENVGSQDEMTQYKEKVKGMIQNVIDIYTSATKDPSKKAEFVKAYDELQNITIGGAGRSADIKSKEVSAKIEKEAKEEERENAEASNDEKIDNVVQDVMNDKEMQQVMKDQGIEQTDVEKEAEDIFKDELSDAEDQVLQKFLGFVKELKALNEVGPNPRDANKRSVLQALGITDKIFKQAVGKLDREEQEMFKNLIRKKGEAVLKVINPDAADKEQPATAADPAKLVSTENIEDFKDEFIKLADALISKQPEKKDHWEAEKETMQTGIEQYLATKGKGLNQNQPHVMGISSLGFTDASIRAHAWTLLNKELGLEPDAKPWEEQPEKEKGSSVKEMMFDLMSGEHNAASWKDTYFAAIDKSEKYLTEKGFDKEELKKQYEGFEDSYLKGEWDVPFEQLKPHFVKTISSLGVLEGDQKGQLAAAWRKSLSSGWIPDPEIQKAAEDAVATAKEEAEEDTPQEEIITRAEEIAMEEPEVQKAVEEEPKAEKAVEKAIEKIASGEATTTGDEKKAPQRINKKKFNSRIKKIKNQAKKMGGRFDIGKATPIIKDLLQARNFNISENLGMGIRSMRDLESALIKVGAIDKDEHSTKITTMLVSTLEEFGLKLDDPAPGKSEEQPAEKQKVNETFQRWKRIVNG